MAGKMKFVQAMDTTVTVGTLANATGLISTHKVDASRLNGIQIEKIWHALGFKGHTVGEGPILYGLAKNLGSITELKEFIEADPSGPANTAETEKTERNIFVMGFLPDVGEVAYGGHMFRQRFPWKTIGEGGTLDFWIFSKAGSAMTTGMTVHSALVISGEWLRD